MTSKKFNTNEPMTKKTKQQRARLQVNLRVTAEEKSAWERAAERAGLSMVARWIKQVLNAAAK
jgi:uncharacterized protein (DUF1778 family)